MAGTKIADIIQSPRWVKYFYARVIALNALIASGVITVDNKLKGLAAAKGAPIINLPFWNRLTGTSEVLSDSSALAVNKITAGKHRAYILARGKAWDVNDLADIRSADDPAKAIADGLATFWSSDEQTTLLSILKGIMADNVANDGADLYLDLYSDVVDPAASNKLSADTFITGKAKMGDAAAKLVLVAMHSNVYFSLQRQDLIDTVRPSEDVEFEVFQGRRIIVDDDMPVESGTNQPAYTTFLLANGAIARDVGWPGPKPEFETDRDILAGNTVITNRRQLILHPQGYDATSGSIAGDTATNTELENAANWSRTAEKKATGIVAIRHNI